MGYQIQNFEKGKVLEHTHLINIENAILDLEGNQTITYENDLNPTSGVKSYIAKPLQKWNRPKLVRRREL